MIPEAAYKFDYNGNCESCTEFDSGHVNKTYLVTTDCGCKYTLQLISSYAFHDIPGLVDNAVRVSAHIKSKGGRSLDFIKAKDGRDYYIDSNGDYWRTYEFVDDCICLLHPECPEDFYQSASAFGTFQSMLSDFPASTLCETIPRFHDTPDRFRKLHEAMDNNYSGRRNLVADEIRFALEREKDCGALMDMLRSGELPLRVTHNDTKLSNVLLDKNTRKPVCVIDLDTVMPGLSAFDFGDAIRFGASTASEDEKDLNLVNLDMDLYKLFADGFLRACPELTENEKKALPLGAKLITLECGVRFLTDYLDGDKYFGIAYPDHNLVRARTQFKLVSDMENRWDEMLAVIS